MSGLKQVLPKTKYSDVIGCAALAGLSRRSADFSPRMKSVAQTWSHSYLLGTIVLFTAFLTEYYTFQSLLPGFQGPVDAFLPSTAEGHGHDAHHEARCSVMRHEASAM